MKRTVALMIVVVAVVAATALYMNGWGRDTGLVASGTVEARNIRVGSKEGGRIVEVLVREGDRVERGQALVKFDEEPLASRVEQARGRLAQARANLEKMERGSRPEEIAEARAAAAEAEAALAERTAGYRREEIAQARADLERAQADAVNAERTFKRWEDLAAQGVFSRQQRDDTEAAWKMAVARRDNAAQRLQELERGYRVEQVAQARAHHQQTEATREKVERGFRREDIAAARADLERAQGELREAEARLMERHVTAPSPATVEVLDVRPGDLIPPNTPIATLLERDQLYIRIYVPETRIGQVRVGQKAELRVDSYPGQVFEAVVEQINQKAEFLPRNVQTREEREHQVFGVKLRVRDERIKAGMAADVRLKP
jgi:multidrug resistance efflux pump